jgi:hypothetical protein
MPCLIVLAEMEYYGVRFDGEACRETRASVEAAMERCQQQAPGGVPLADSRRVKAALRAAGTLPPRCTVASLAALGTPLGLLASQHRQLVELLEVVSACGMRMPAISSLINSTLIYRN